MSGMVQEQLITSVRKVVEQVEKADAIVYANFYTGELKAHRTFAIDTVGEVKLGKARRSC
ncbi:hypothetical protein OG225_10515 [Nocardia sp. NBC_01377]|uniref:hypothetical protein n=1 Tax=Nocardia sp. NBC_01377 TaxID=2903595 RepID=UPI00324C0ACC